ncbi:MAG: type II secretion system major pseudopilin GspG [Kiritimatiellae bacterium]|nr:type II secretion system major pseudopilin GspG [Kiritimatiellia bacterium]
MDKTRSPLRFNNERRSRAGFTLMEVLVVVLIITILATLVGVQVAGGPGKARVALANAQLQSFRTALQIFKADNGRYPTQGQGLQALVEQPTREPIPAQFPDEGYLSSPRVPMDPWGNPYVYLIPGSASTPYEIVTYGANAAPGGEGEDADISSSNF